VEYSRMVTLVVLAMSWRWRHCSVAIPWRHGASGMAWWWRRRGVVAARPLAMVPLGVVELR
jgi:hypothetical protein